MESKNSIEIQSEMEKENLSSSIQNNLIQLRAIFKGCSDFIIREFILHTKEKENIKAYIFYIDGLIDNVIIQKQILEPLMNFTVSQSKTEISMMMDQLILSKLSIGEVKILKNIEKIKEAVLSGDTVLLIDGNKEAIGLNTKGWEKRSIVDPPSESIVRGPKEGFVETLRTNTSLLRRKIKSSDLKIKMKKIGRKTATDVAIVYLENIVQPSLVQEIEKRMDEIEIDGVFDGGYIEQMIGEQPYGIFPQAINTERPDKAAANLLEGRVVIIVDGSPNVLIFPVTLTSLYQSPEDYYEGYIIGSFLRVLRLLGIFISTSFPSIYIALISFHQELMPSNLILQISKTREMVPYAPVVEAFFMEVTVELLREASSRLPMSINQSIGIVGAIILGQAAVEAGLASPAMVIVLSITAIGSFVVPQYSSSYTLRYIRFPIMFMAGILGGYGIIISWFILIGLLCRMESFGYPFLYPIAPVEFSDWKDSILRFPFFHLKKRPKIPYQQEKKRFLKKGGNQNE